MTVIWERSDNGMEAPALAPTPRPLDPPRVVGTGDTTFRPAFKAEALRTLAPSTLLMFVPGAARVHSFQLLGRLVDSVPSYWLELGGDVIQIKDAVRRMIDAAEAS